MRARPGARIVLAATHVGEQTRDGRVVEVRGADGGPPFVVEWSDGHTGLIYPGPGAVLRLSGEHEEDRSPVQAGAGTATAGEAGATATATATAEGATGSGPDTAGAPSHVREWSVRISIFETGDDTNAQAVLLADAPDHLRATGHSHRAHRDPSVPEIGDEVAVARALRHLADRLMTAADDDIEAVTGEEVHVQRT